MKDIIIKIIRERQEDIQILRKRDNEREGSLERDIMREGDNERYTVNREIRTKIGNELDR